MKDVTQLPLVARSAQRTSKGKVGAAGGQIEGISHSKLLATGTSLMMVHHHFEKGYHMKGHSHPENESIGFVIEGRLRMHIGSEVFELGPGDSWFHPRGVHHETQALENTLAVEVYSPHRKDIIASFEDAF